MKLHPRKSTIERTAARPDSYSHLKALNSVDSSFTENGLVTQINLHSWKQKQLFRFWLLTADTSFVQHALPLPSGPAWAVLCTPAPLCLCDCSFFTGHSYFRIIVVSHKHFQLLFSQSKHLFFFRKFFKGEKKCILGIRFHGMKTAESSYQVFGEKPNRF